MVDLPRKISGSFHFLWYFYAFPMLHLFFQMGRAWQRVKRTRRKPVWDRWSNWTLTSMSSCRWSGYGIRFFNLLNQGGIPKIQAASRRKKKQSELFFSDWMVFWVYSLLLKKAFLPVKMVDLSLLMLVSARVPPFLETSKYWVLNNYNVQLMVCEDPQCIRLSKHVCSARCFMNQPWSNHNLLRAFSHVCG